MSSLLAGIRVIKMVFFFALPSPRRELQQIISICHQMEKVQNESFPSIHTLEDTDQSVFLLGMLLPRSKDLQLDEGEFE